MRSNVYMRVCQALLCNIQVYLSNSYTQYGWQNICTFIFKYIMKIFYKMMPYLTLCILGACMLAHPPRQLIKSRGLNSFVCSLKIAYNNLKPRQ